MESIKILLQQKMQTILAQGNSQVSTQKTLHQISMQVQNQFSNDTLAGIAPGETGRIWGDPHFEGGDGDRFDVQGEAGKSYHLLSDTGLLLNGKFASAGQGKTVVAQTGLQLSGVEGTSHIYVAARPRGTVIMNGQTLHPGQSAPLADGGELFWSQDGQAVTIQTAEGYTLTQQIKNPGPKGEMEIQVRTPQTGVAKDGRLPQGLLGQTFDLDSQARHSQDPQGAGAIDGTYQDYEVAGGVFGSPSPRVSAQPTNIAGLHQLMKNLEISPEGSLRFPAINPLTMAGINWQEEIQQSTIEGIYRESTRQAKLEVLVSDQRVNRLTHLLAMAIQSGNISLAMMLFAHAEARDSNILNQGLLKKIQSLQEKKRQLSSRMVQQGNDAQGAKNYQMLKTEMDSVNDDIGLLQTFLREVAQNKQQALELSNAFLSQEHQTAMSIIRSFAR